MQPTKDAKRFSFDMLHDSWPEPQGKRRGAGLGAPLPSMKRIRVEIKPLAVFYITQTKLTCEQHLVSARSVLTFNFMFEAAATCAYWRYSVSYTKSKIWQNIPYEYDSKKVENLRYAPKHSLKIFNQLYKS